MALKGKLPTSFASSTATSGDLPFEVPQPPKHATHCNLCKKDFPTSRALRRHLRMHRGKTNHMCKMCGKHLTSSCMMDMHEASCSSRDFLHNCKTCGKGHHTKEECTWPDCKVEFNLVKTMREHQATHRGPFPCQVEDCPTMFSLPKCCNHHLHKKHGFDAKRY